MHRPLPREAKTVLALLAASLALRLAFAAWADVFQDEVLYWWQGREPGVGFSPQPPVVPLSARGAALLLGDGTVALRLPSLAAGTLAIAVAYLLGRDMYGGPGGLWAAALVAACPLFVALGAVSTPDAPLLALWLLAMWTAWRGANGGSLGWWLACGATVALGLYTKYMMVLALPCGFLALAATPRGRRLLRGWGPWLAAGVATVLFVPVFLAWNRANGWAAMRYHLSARHEWEFEWDVVGQYVAGHAGALSPVLYVGALGALVAAWRAWRRRGDWRGAWLLAFGAVPILFFLPPSVFTKHRMMRVQWDEMGYAVGAVGLGAMAAGAELSTLSRRARRRLGAAALAVAVFLTGGLMSASFCPPLAVAAGTRPPTLKMLGWRELAARVRREAARWEDARGPFVAGESFVTALCLAYHLDTREGIYALPDHRNVYYGLFEQLREWGVSQWHMRRDRGGQDAIYVHEYRLSEPIDESPPKHAARSFQEVELVDVFEVAYRGEVVRRFGIYRCRGCRPLFADPPALLRALTPPPRLPPRRPGGRPGPAPSHTPRSSPAPGPRP